MLFLFDAQEFVHDVMGGVIETMHLNNFKKGALTFDLEKESNGIYYCSAISKDNRQTKKIIVNK